MTQNNDQYTNYIKFLPGSKVINMNRKSFDMNNNNFKVETENN